MKSRKHLVSRILFTMLATDEENGVALSPGTRFGGSPISANSAPTTGVVHQAPPFIRTGLGPGILNSGISGDRDLEQEENGQSLEEGEEYEDEFEEDPDGLLEKREKLLDSDDIPYHKRPGFCMSHSRSQLCHSLHTH